MTASAIVRASAALSFCMAAVVSGQARAQNYDGAGQLRFGAFGQLAATDFDIKRPIEIREPGAVDLTPATSTLFGFDGSASDTSFGGGVTFGYDYLFQSGLVLGAEADIAFDTLQTDARFREYTVDYLATLRARLGYYVHPDILLYGTAGVSFLGAGFEGIRSPLSGFRFREEKTEAGWTAGAGIEFGWQGFILFGEYLFTSHDEFKFTETVELFEDQTELINSRGFKNEFDVEQHVFRIGAKLVIGHDFRSEDAYVPLK